MENEQRSTARVSPASLVSAEIERIAKKFGKSKATISGWAFKNSRTYRQSLDREKKTLERLERLAELEKRLDAKQLSKGAV